MFFQTGRQHNGIFNRLADTLSKVWSHRVGGIAEQSDQAPNKPRQRVNFVDVAPQNRPFLRARDQCPYRFVPSSKQSQRHIFGPPFWIPLPLRHIVRGKPVDSPAGHRNNSKPATSSPRFSGGELAFIELDDGPPRRIPCIPNVFVAKYLVRIVLHNPSTPMSPSPWAVSPVWNRAVAPSQSCSNPIHVRPRWSRSGSRCCANSASRSARCITERPNSSVEIATRTLPFGLLSSPRTPKLLWERKSLASANTSSARWTLAAIAIPAPTP
jgi:hypothetical protein